MPDDANNSMPDKKAGAPTVEAIDEVLDQVSTNAIQLTKFEEQLGGLSTSNQEIKSSLLELRTGVQQIGDMLVGLSSVLTGTGRATYMSQLGNVEDQASGLAKGQRTLILFGIGQLLLVLIGAALFVFLSRRGEAPPPAPTPSAAMMQNAIKAVGAPQPVEAVQPVQATPQPEAQPAPKPEDDPKDKKKRKRKKRRRKRKDE